LHCFKGVTENSFVVTIKYFWYDFKHFKLIMRNLMGFTYECAMLVQFIPHQHKNIFLKIVFIYSIDEWKQGHNRILNWLNHGWNKLRVLTDIAYHIPHFVDQNLFLLLAFNLFFYLVR
jgi:hypothetical protein